jgi:hypothetical protein
VTLSEIVAWLESLDRPLFYAALVLGYISALICAATAGRRR